MTDKLESLIHRLEAAASRIEELAQNRRSSAPANEPLGAITATTSTPPIVKAFDDLLGSHFQRYLDLSKKIGGEVQTQADLVEKAFRAQREYLLVAASAKQPSAAELQEVLKPTAKYLEAAQSLKEANRSSKTFNHLSCVSEGLPALGWVAVSPKPVPYVEEFVNATQFYGNRVIKEFKDKEPTHVDWVRAFTNSLKEIQEYVKTHHTTGLVWNNKSNLSAKDASISLANHSSKGSSAPPPPPPPPPAAFPSASSPTKPGISSSSPSSHSSDMAQLFSAINQGSAITGGLKKVEKSQMTHKNADLKSSGVVKATASTHETGQTNQTRGGVAKCCLEGKKWMVENQQGGEQSIENPDKKETVYIYKCFHNTVHIKGKVNSIMVDGCKKTAVIFESAVAALEIVNSQGIQVQVLGNLPTLSIDKSDGIQIYLSKESLQAEIVSSKSSEMNVLIPGASDSDDWIEFALPEQFKTTWQDSKFVTQCVEHSAG